MPEPMIESLPYDQRLASDPRWALSEGSKFFEERSAVQDALRKITGRLNQLNIPYAVAGGMALFLHGFRRFTEDVDLLVTRAGLQAIHEALDGLGYVPPFTGSKNLRDTETGVKVEFLVTGQYPGDGKPKAVAFPDPAGVTVEHDGIRYLALAILIELKLASGMSNTQRLKDLVDVQELIKLRDLPADYADRLDASVRPQYHALWQIVHAPIKCYTRRWRVALPPTSLAAPADLAALLTSADLLLATLLAEGITLDVERGIVEGHVTLVTTDPALARKYDLHDAAEFLDEGFA